MARTFKRKREEARRQEEEALASFQRSKEGRTQSFDSKAARKGLDLTDRARRIDPNTLLGKDRFLDTELQREKEKTVAQSAKAGFGIKASEEQMQALLRAGGNRHREEEKAKKLAPSKQVERALSFGFDPVPISGKRAGRPLPVKDYLTASQLHFIGTLQQSVFAGAGPYRRLSHAIQRQVEKEGGGEELEAGYALPLDEHEARAEIAAFISAYETALNAGRDPSKPKLRAPKFDAWRPDFDDTIEAQLDRWENDAVASATVARDAAHGDSPWATRGFGAVIQAAEAAPRGSRGPGPGEGAATVLYPRGARPYDPITRDEFYAADMPYVLIPQAVKLGLRMNKEGGIAPTRMIRVRFTGTQQMVDIPVDLPDRAGREAPPSLHLQQLALPRETGPLLGKKRSQYGIVSTGLVDPKTNEPIPDWQLIDRRAREAAAYYWETRGQTLSDEERRKIAAWGVLMPGGLRTPAPSAHAEIQGAVQHALLQKEAMLTGKAKVVEKLPKPKRHLRALSSDEIAFLHEHGWIELEDAYGAKAEPNPFAPKAGKLAPFVPAAKPFIPEAGRVRGIPAEVPLEPYVPKTRLTGHPTADGGTALLEGFGSGAGYRVTFLSAKGLETRVAAFGELWEALNAIQPAPAAARKAMSGLTST